jgi:hypothetical protein
MATIATPTPTCKALIDDLYGPTDPSGPAWAAPEPLPEAAFSLTIHGTIGGHTAMLTIRGQSPDTFRANVAAVRGLLDTPAPDAQPASPGTPPAAPAETPEGWCALHGVQMKHQSNQRGSWWSHKVGDTWCRGKEHTRGRPGRPLPLEGIAGTARLRDAACIQHADARIATRLACPTLPTGGTACRATALPANHDGVLRGCRRSGFHGLWSWCVLGFVTTWEFACDKPCKADNPNQRPAATWSAHGFPLSGSPVNPLA